MKNVVAAETTAAVAIHAPKLPFEQVQMGSILLQGRQPACLLNVKTS